MNEQKRRVFEEKSSTGSEFVAIHEDAPSPLSDFTERMAERNGMKVIAIPASRKRRKISFPFRVPTGTYFPGARPKPKRATHRPTPSYLQYADIAVAWAKAGPKARRRFLKSIKGIKL